MMEIFEKDEEAYWYAVGIAFRKARKNANYKQREVVEKLSVSRSQIANTETGRSRVSMWRLKQMADLYGCDPVGILNPPTPPPKKDVKELQTEIEDAEEKLLELRAQKKSLGVVFKRPQS